MIQVGNDHLDNQIFKSTMVKLYNTHKGGIERVDQQLYAIQTLRKSCKWYKKLAFRLIMQMSLNAFKVFQHHTAANAEVTYLSFFHDTIALMITAIPDIPQHLINEPGTDGIFLPKRCHKKAVKIQGQQKSAEFVMLKVSKQKKADQ